MVNEGGHTKGSTIGSDANGADINDTSVNSAMHGEHQPGKHPANDTFGQSQDASANNRRETPQCVGTNDLASDPTGHANTFQAGIHTSSSNEYLWLNGNDS